MKTYLGKLTITLIFLSIIGSSTYAQLVVTLGSTQINSGSTVSITAVPSMPDLVLSVQGGTSCDNFGYTIQLNYTDQAGATTTASYNGQNLNAGDAVHVDWLGVIEGGTATLTWNFDGASQTGFSFNINGTNPPNNAIDSYLASSNAPWFARNLVAWESAAWNVNIPPTGQYKQFNTNNSTFPVLWGGPDGVGLMQVEMNNRAKGDADFWSWPANIVDGLQFLSNILATNSATKGPYTSWTKEYNDMVMTTNGHPVAANWPSDCISHANGALCGGFDLKSPTFYCSFSSDNSNGSPNAFGDANWMHAYNGFYFVSWMNATPQIPGHWEYDLQSPNDGYTYHVCTSAPL